MTNKTSRDNQEEDPTPEITREKEELTKITTKQSSELPSYHPPSPSQMEKS